MNQCPLKYASPPSAYDIPTFKTNALCLFSNEGRLKRLWQLYKRLMYPYLSLLWL